VFQEGQGVGDIIISTGTVREGGTPNGYLPIEFPAVPTYAVLHHLVDAAASLETPVTVGVGMCSDVYYAPLTESAKERRAEYVKAGVVAIEMESDTLFVMGAYRGWRTGAIFTSDGVAGPEKPPDRETAFRAGEAASIRVALRAMRNLAREDGL
jgi:uridine phosphorylase